MCLNAFTGIWGSDLLFAADSLSRSSGLHESLFCSQQLQSFGSAAIQLFRNSFVLMFVYSAVLLGAEVALDDMARSKRAFAV